MKRHSYQALLTFKHLRTKNNNEAKDITIHSEKFADKQLAERELSDMIKRKIFPGVTKIIEQKVIEVDIPAQLSFEGFVYNNGCQYGDYGVFLDTGDGSIQVENILNHEYNGKKIRINIELIE